MRADLISQTPPKSLGDEREASQRHLVWPGAVAVAGLRQTGPGATRWLETRPRLLQEGQLF
ncbi:MAG: hypothetical protein ACK56I_13385, partial [bacterium]